MGEDMGGVVGVRPDETGIFILGVDFGVWDRDEAEV